MREPDADVSLAGGILLHDSGRVVSKKSKAV
jgi:hypothetical protein